MFAIKIMTMLLFVRILSAILKPKGGGGGQQTLTQAQLASSCIAPSLLPLRTPSFLCNQLDWAIRALDGCGSYVSLGGYHAIARRPLEPPKAAWEPTLFLELSVFGWP